ncbi:MAG: homoserine O-succinyltransferase, partial [Gammaproteobacteria bacterium]|nr:homoserine O-succinyltransferase [Gammaproteobacteria bacterium]
QIAQFYVHPFTLKELERDKHAQAHVDDYYKSFEQIKEEGLDALIITGANVIEPELSDEAFWEPLIDVFDWAVDNATSILCSCLATHAVLQFRYGQKRRPLPKKRWGVYSHRVNDKSHPLTTGVNTRFDVPHSRFNQVDKTQFEVAGLKVLVESEQGDVHLAVSEDGFRIVFFQGHPEYDTISLMKEYKREVGRYVFGEIENYPPFPENYFSLRNKAIFEEYQELINDSRIKGTDAPEFPEALIIPALDNTWHDSGEAVINNWIGKVYQLTHIDRRIPFREGIDPANPLGLL